MSLAYWLNKLIDKEEVYNLVTYCIGTNEEEFSGQYPTKTAAIEAAFEEFDGYDVIYVGEVEQRTIGEYFLDNDAITVIEGIATNAYEECGEVADNYLADTTKDQVESLKLYLRKTLEKWANEHGQQPKFWHVRNVESFARGKGD